MTNFPTGFRVVWRAMLAGFLLRSAIADFYVHWVWTVLGLALVGFWAWQAVVAAADDAAAMGRALRREILETLRRGHQPTPRSGVQQPNRTERTH